MFGGIASAIGSIAGGLLGNKSQSDANALNAQLTREQIEYQKELHKNQIQWRVEDSKKAGLHPLAGLGVSSYSYTPVSGGVSGQDYGWLGDAAGALGDGLSRMGQNANAEKQRDKDAKARAQAEALAADTAQAQLDLIRSQIDGQKVDNDLRRFELASRMRRSTDPTQIGPPAPSTRGVQGATIPGQTESANPAYDAPIRSFGFRKDGQGRKTDIVPSDDYKSRTEDTLFIEWLPWYESMKKNVLAKVFGQKVDGYWWHPGKGEYTDYPPNEWRGKFRR